jgi:hypothetical protein
MDSKKINQLGTNVSPVLSDLTVIGNPITGQLKKITWLQVANMIGTAGTGAVLKTEVTNRTGVTLTKGTVVYINGAYNGIPTVAKAQANAEATSAQTFGLIENDIDNFANGFVVIAGKLTDANTNGIAAGTQLYLSGSTAGGFTTTKPYAPTRLVYVGIVIKESATEGIIEVAIQNGVDLSEIHDVSAQTPANNDGIFYNSTTGLWESKSISTVYTPPVTSVFGRTGAVVAAEGDYNLTQLGDVTISSPTNGQVLKYNGTAWVNGTDSGITGSGTANQLAYFDSTSSITSSSNFTINNSTGYLIAPYIFASTELVISGTSGDNNKIYLSGTDFMIRSTFDNLRLQGGINNSNKRQVNIYNGDTLAINVETTGVTTFYNIPALATAASLFLVSDSGGLKSRTAAQVLSDIGAQGALTLTTTGTSGAATLVGNTLNIPQYQSVLTNPVTGTGSAGQVAYWTGTTTQTGSNNLFWDATNSRLGIGLVNPDYPLHISTTGNSASRVDLISTTVLTNIWNQAADGIVIGNNIANSGNIGAGVGIKFILSTTSNPFAGIYAIRESTTASALTFWTQDVNGSVLERVKITGTGLSYFYNNIYGSTHIYFGMNTGADYYLRTPNVDATSTGRRGLMLSNGSTTDLKIVAGGNQTLGNWTESDKLMVIGTGYQGGGGSGETILFHSSGIGNMMAISALNSTIYTYLPTQSQSTISLMNSSSSYIDFTIPKASFNLQFYGNYWNSSTGATQLYSGAIFGIPNTSNVASAPSTRIVIQPGSTDTIYALSTGVVRFPQYGSNGFLKSSNSDGTIIVDTTSYLPLGGGTLTGALSGTSGSFSSTLTASAFIPTGSTIPTNGMYLSATNRLAFSVGSANVLQMDYTTGIATFSQAVTGTYFFVTSNSGTNNFGVNVETGDGYLGTSTNHDLYLTRNNIDRLRIKSSGNIIATNTVGLTLAAHSTAGLFIGDSLSTSGSSLFVKTGSVASYSSGFGVDGTYSGGLSRINLRAIGSQTTGGYASAMSFILDNNGTARTHASFDSDKVSRFYGTVDGFVNSGEAVAGQFHRLAWNGIPAFSVYLNSASAFPFVYYRMANGRLGVNVDNPAVPLDVSLQSGTNGDVMRMSRSAGSYTWRKGVDSNSLYYIANNGGTTFLSIHPDSGFVRTEYGSSLSSGYHGKKVLIYGPSSSETINLPAQFPQVALVNGNSWAVIGRCCFLGAGGTVEVREFYIGKSATGTWSTASYNNISATTGSLQSVTGSGNTIIVNMNSSTYVTIELTVMIR